MFKEILFDKKARDKIFEGVDIVTNAVATTLGPKGQNVIFEESMYPTITKDGVTVAQQIFLDDKFKNMGVMIAREAAENTNREAGDGTTTTIVLLREIFREGLKAVAAGMNPILLKRGMDHCQQLIVDMLNKQSKKVTSQDEKLQIATISSNNDPEIGKMIVEVLDEVGTSGVVTVGNSPTLNTEVEYTKGMRLNAGYLAHVFMNDPKRLSVVIENPTIVITTDTISLHSQLVPLLQKLLKAGKKEIILFANEIEGQALGFLIQNHLQGKFHCVPVKVPSFGAFQEDIIYDLATSIGAQVLGEAHAKKIESAEVNDCGTCEQITIDRDQTILQGAKGDIKGRIQEVKTLLKEEKDLFRKEKLKERLGRLTGSIATIKAGGTTESEQQELKYRIEDALNATKSAIQEGIVQGGGVALLTCYSQMPSSTSSDEFNTGIKIVKRCLKAPLKMIAENAGQVGDEVVGKVLDHKIGYNALTDTYEDLFEAGVIDPTKVVRNSIQNAIATAGVLLTSNVAIVNKEVKND